MHQSLKPIEYILGTTITPSMNKSQTVLLQYEEGSMFFRAAPHAARCMEV
jgi:hypothetical protein